MPTGLLADVTAMPGIAAATWNMTSIGPLNFTNSLLDDTHLLSTEFTEFVAAPLRTIDPIEIGVQWDYTLGLDDNGTTMDWDESGTFTITLPKHSFTTPGNITGTGVIAGISMPIGTPGDRSLGTITIQYDGKTNLAFVASA